MALFKRYVQNVADAILHVADSVDNPSVEQPKKHNVLESVHHLQLKLGLPKAKGRTVSEAVWELAGHVSGGGGYPEPTGTTNITENGTHNVKDFEFAEVNVPGIVPTGTLTITENGQYDVSEYDKANVNIPTSEGLVLFSATPKLYDEEASVNFQTGETVIGENGHIFPSLWFAEGGEYMWGPVGATPETGDKYSKENLENNTASFVNSYFTPYADADSGSGFSYGYHLFINGLRMEWQDTEVVADEGWYTRFENDVNRLMWGNYWYPPIYASAITFTTSQFTSLGNKNTISNGESTFIELQPEQKLYTAYKLWKFLQMALGSDSGGTINNPKLLNSPIYVNDVKITSFTMFPLEGFDLSITLENGVELRYDPIDYDNQSKGGYVHQTDGPSGFIADKFEIRIDEFN